eukprot:SAG25_NODE_2878_length_1338_cov_1.933818_2_plen_80_part_00
MQVRCPLASLYHRMTQSIGTSDNAPYIAASVGEGGLSLRMWSSVFERVLCSKPVTHEYEMPASSSSRSMQQQEPDVACM